MCLLCGQLWLTPWAEPMGTFHRNWGSHSDGRCPDFEIWAPLNRHLIWFYTSDSDPDDQQSRLMRCWVIVYSLHLSPGDHQGVPRRSCWNLEVLSLYFERRWKVTNSTKLQPSPLWDSLINKTARFLNISSVGRENRGRSGRLLYVDRLFSEWNDLHHTISATHHS